MARIMVIDDNENIRETLSEILALHNYEVSAASNGCEALELLAREGADLIITDLIMPEKEGLEIIFEFKHHHPEVKIIAISGGGRNKPDSYLNLAKSAGAAATFCKPISKKEFVETVNNLVK